MTSGRTASRAAAIWIRKLRAWSSRGLWETGSLSCRLRLLRRRAIARKHSLRCGQQCPGLELAILAEIGERALFRRDAKQVEKLRSGYRHVGLNKNADLTQDFSGDVE